LSACRRRHITSFSVWSGWLGYPGAGRIPCLKRHYESKACFLFIYFTIRKDKSINNLFSLKILDTQCNPYLAWQTSKNQSEIKNYFRNRGRLLTHVTKKLCLHVIHD
jgi:hypothetical protein